MSENHFLNDLPRKLLLKNNLFDWFSLLSHLKIFWKVWSKSVAIFAYYITAVFVEEHFCLEVRRGDFYVFYTRQWQILE